MNDIRHTYHSGNSRVWGALYQDRGQRPNIFPIILHTLLGISFLLPKGFFKLLEQESNWPTEGKQSFPREYGIVTNNLLIGTIWFGHYLPHGLANRKIQSSERLRKKRWVSERELPGSFSVFQGVWVPACSRNPAASPIMGSVSSHHRTLTMTFSSVSFSGFPPLGTKRLLW